MAEGQICAVEGCTNVLTKTSGRICQAHRSRKFRHGSYDISENWTHSKKGKPCKTPLGYMRILVDGRRVLQHRYVMEQYLGRKLSSKERVHHKNGDRSDNRIENLELCSSNSEHMKKHHQYSWHARKIRPIYSPDTIAAILTQLNLPTPGRGHDYPSDATCFCGEPIMARNLCEKHYQWAYAHNFT